MNEMWVRPKRRSRLRIAAGVWFYRLLRWGQWIRMRGVWARTREEASAYPFVAVEHRTPLIRRLRNVDMELQHNKITNLRIAAERVNGLTVRPGERFSYWYTIGRPTRAKGYVDGMVLDHGQIRRGVGGGLCQLSNLLYWMTLHTPLTVAERWRHSYDVFPDADRTQPFGSGATCFYNYMDLQIQNDTQWDWLLEVEVTDTHLVGRWRTREPVPYQYRVTERNHRIIPSPYGGYFRCNQLYRDVYENGEWIGEELIAENHALMMYEPMLESGGKREDAR